MVHRRAYPAVYPHFVIWFNGLDQDQEQTISFLDIRGRERTKSIF